LDEVGNFAAGWIWNHRIGLETRRQSLAFLVAAGVLRDELPGVDHRCVAAKRQGGGFGRRIRRSGQSNGIRAERCGDNPFASDNVVRDYVHGLRDGTGFARGPRSEHGRIGDLQYDETGCNQTSNASTGYAGSGNDPCTEFIDACDATTAATGSGTGSADCEKVAFLFDSVAGNVRRS